MPRSTMRVPQPDIIEHFGNADAVPHTEPQRGASERNRRLRRLLARRSAGAVLEPLGGNCAVLPKGFGPGGYRICPYKKSSAFRLESTAFSLCPGVLGQTAPAQIQQSCGQNGKRRHQRDEPVFGKARDQVAGHTGRHDDHGVLHLGLHMVDVV